MEPKLEESTSASAATSAPGKYLEYEVEELREQITRLEQRTE